jgi:hypothetical protein
MRSRELGVQQIRQMHFLKTVGLICSSGTSMSVMDSE